MKQRKIAISLAIVGAIAAPFVFRTYKAQPKSETWIPLTAEIKENALAYMKQTNNCQEFVDRAQKSAALEACRFEQKALKEGGMYGPRLSRPLYLALNVAAAAVGFIVIFDMAYLLPALARRAR